MIVWRSVFEESQNWTSVYVFMWKNYRNGSSSGGYVQYRFHWAQVQGFVNHDVHWKGKKAFLNGQYWNCGNFFSCSRKYIETEQVTIFFLMNEQVTFQKYGPRKASIDGPKLSLKFILENSESSLAITRLDRF